MFKYVNKLPINYHSISILFLSTVLICNPYKWGFIIPIMVKRSSSKQSRWKYQQLGEIQAYNNFWGQRFKKKTLKNSTFNKALIEQIRGQKEIQDNGYSLGWVKNIWHFDRECSLFKGRILCHTHHRCSSQPLC